MQAFDFTAPRLFVDAPLGAGMVVVPDRSQAHYLVRVLRLGEGDEILVFNGRDGEWVATLRAAGAKRSNLQISARTRPQPPPGDLHYLFVPLRQARLDYMVQKAVELGAGRLRPVLSQHGQVRRLKPERLRANAIEAAEQCGLLSLPVIDELAPLDGVLEAWESDHPGRRLLFGDESSGQTDPLAILSELEGAPLAVLIGPEGGFSADERRRLKQLPFTTALPLGPRILRADTAAVAILALVQAALGDWRERAPARGG
jgi:16S rRNA (uracil1498-N3)-methyltransferase